MKEQQNAPGHTLFRDYVSELPHQWVLDNLISADMPRRIVSSAMVTEAASKFSTKTALVKRYKGLSPALRLKCAQVYLTGGAGLTLEGNGALAKNPLLTSLLVYAARGGVAAQAGGGAPVRLFGFQEFESVLRPLMAQTLADAGAAGDVQPHVSGCLWRPLNDVAAVCSLVFQGTLLRSAHGGLSRTSLGVLKKLVNDPTLSGKSVPEEGVYGHPAGFIIGYCLKDGLIVDVDNEYKLNGTRFAAWLEIRMKDRMRKLADYATEFLGGFNANLLREALKAAEGRSLSVNFFVPESARDAAARAVSALEFLGYAHTLRGQTQGCPASKFTLVKEPADALGGDLDKLSADRSASDAVMMPDFTAIIPQEAMPSELFEFSKMGLLTGCDKVYKGRISKESISNSLSAGTPPDDIRDRLKISRAPANVARTVEEWIREFGRLYSAHGSILAVSEERVAKQIAALEPLKKYLTKIEAHTVYMIKPCCDRKVIDVLEKLGFDAREPGGRNVNLESGIRNKFISVQASAELRDDSELNSTSKEIIPLASSLSEISQQSPDNGEWKLVTDFSSAQAKEKAPPPPMRGTKYGSRLKPLGISEMIHVIDYAMLTNQSIIVDYEGGTAVKQNLYTVVPLNLDKGINAAVEAEIPGIRGRKKLFLDKINRIGVVARG